MSNVTLLIPLRLPYEKRFFDHGPNTLFGHAARLKLDAPYCYIEFPSVPARDADAVLMRVRRSLIWAAVRLDMGILTGQEPLKTADAGGFDGQFATAYPEGANTSPMRVEGGHWSEEPSTRLFGALAEADMTHLNVPAAKQSLALACELFAGVDFEATANSQFLMLTSVFEVLANPKKRPKICIDLVEELLDRAEKAKAGADDETKEALNAFRESAVHLKKESITSSVRKLATKASHALGDSDPEKAGKRAAALYAKRSGLVHRGKSVTWGDVTKLRTLVREMLAVEAGCFEHIRERFP